MKKVLLGLLAISAVAMATNKAEQSIEVETTAKIINSGLIITDSASGDEQMTQALTLDHGSFMASETRESTVTKSVYVRRLGGENLPVGTIIDVELDGVGTLNLNGSAGATDKIAHTLTANVDSGTAVYVSGDEIPTLDGDNTTDTKVTGQFKATGNVKIDLTSVIASGAYSSKTTEGDYSNTTQLFVRYSKNGGQTQAPGR